jgi:hypothetical protein
MDIRYTCVHDHTHISTLKSLWSNVCDQPNDNIEALENVLNNVVMSEKGIHTPTDVLTRQGLIHVIFCGIWVVV